MERFFAEIRGEKASFHPAMVPMGTCALPLPPCYDIISANTWEAGFPKGWGKDDDCRGKEIACRSGGRG